MKPKVELSIRSAEEIYELFAGYEQRAFRELANAIAAAKAEALNCYLNRKPKETKPWAQRKSRT